MSDRVLVVESPAKAGTIRKYLGKGYQVVASYGHVRDLLAKQGGVDPKHDFHMTYVSSERSVVHITAIANALKNAKELLLATDPDREGEAIAWHVLELMKERGLLDKIKVQRVVFHEITKRAVLEAVQHPRELSMDLVNAQLARRALDFLVGFNLSPLLWKKIRYGLSAGRVQSPALRLIVTREDEVANFEAREYWDVTATCTSNNERFDAKLVSYQGQKLDQFTIKNAQQAESYRQQIERDAGGILTVEQVVRKERKRKAAPPFTTSTLQQEAARKLGMTAKRTMSVAQKLYEAGYITYMRTDSVSLSVEAVDEIRSLIRQLYGADSVPTRPPRYQNKSKNAQEAHEAIRPTRAQNLPDELSVPLEQQKLYRLIWQRAIASQMAPAVFDTMTVELRAADHLFVARGSVLLKKGFLEVYQEGTDDKQQDEPNDTSLPPLEVGQPVTLLALMSKQHFTEPPPFYNEATLVKTLEAYGIGRPSTYATIIDTLLSREYATLERKQFHPTDIGRVVNEFLVKYFTVYVDYDFTANLEDKLDAVAKGQVEYLSLLEDFWKPFDDRIHEVDAAVSRQEVVQQQLDEVCPKCGRSLQLKLGKRGKFISCSGFPDCDYAKPLTINGDSDQQEDHSSADSSKTVEVYEDHLCPECQGVLHVISGRYGKFVGCSNYPKCKHIEPLSKPKSSGVRCPQCGKGELVERKSRRGKLFYSCECYPTCKYALWDRPIAESCPKCHFPILTIKTSKKDGERKVCPRDGCDWIEQR